MSLWKKAFNRESLFYFSLSLLIILAGQLPIFIHYFHTPVGFYFPFLDQSAPSDFYYIALIRYGMGMEWLTKIPYITVPHQASLIQIPFILMGKLSLFTGIGPAEMLAIFRIIGGSLFLFAAIKLINLLLPKNITKIAFLIFLFVEPLFSFKISIFREPYVDWIWHFGDAARRISVAPPHYTIGKGLALLSVFLLFSHLNRSNKPRFYGSLILGFIGGIVYPPPNFLIAFSLAMAIAIILVSDKLKFKSIKITQLLTFGAYLIACLLPLIILKLELSKGYPWDMWNKVELGWNNPRQQFELQYFRVYWWLFLSLPFALIYLPKIFKDATRALFIFIWSISAYLLFPLADFLSVGKFRFSEGVQIVPLSIAAATLVFHFFKKSKIIRAAGVVTLIGYFIVGGGLVFKESVFRFWPFWKNVYYSPPVLESFKFMETKVPKDSIILTDDAVSTFLPAFVRVRTLYGFSDFYENYADFSNDYMSAFKVLKSEEAESTASEFFRKKNIEYVYLDKTTFGEKPFYPELLTRIFDNEEIAVYKVK